MAEPTNVAMMAMQIESAITPLAGRETAVPELDEGSVVEVWGWGKGGMVREGGRGDE